MVIAIFAIATGAVYSGFTLSQRAYKQGENMAEITQNGRVIIERINRELRQAKEITGDFPETRENAQEEIIFEDGHISEAYNYIHYFKTDGDIKRKVVGHYFSGDPEESLVPWDAIPPDGQTLETKTIEEEKIIGEWVSGVEFWGLGIVNIALELTKKEKTLNLETKIYGRNF